MSFEKIKKNYPNINIEILEKKKPNVYMTKLSVNKDGHQYKLFVSNIYEKNMPADKVEKNMEKSIAKVLKNMVHPVNECFCSCR